MFNILDLDGGQLSELESVLFAAGSLFHPESSLMQGEFVSCANQRIRQPLSYSTDSLSMKGLTKKI